MSVNHIEPEYLPSSLDNEATKFLNTIRSQYSKEGQETFNSFLIGWIAGSVPVSTFNEWVSEVNNKLMPQLPQSITQGECILEGEIVME